MKFKDFWDTHKTGQISRNDPVFAYSKILEEERPEYKRRHYIFIHRNSGVVLRIVVDTDTDEIVHVANE